ncbi:hypothetical protein SAMN04489864_110118 [Pedobacter insulae]|uniref:Uncharacterized protein n=1 Tax=Pedobacter insulae TaxID=414048 RepID=A0A1I2ZL53_9SPHI|nr:hypothetical protein SAMN04489864_110118 [Pedobacter insulae]
MLNKINKVVDKWVVWEETSSLLKYVNKYLVC